MFLAARLHPGRTRLRRFDLRWSNSSIIWVEKGIKRRDYGNILHAKCRQNCYHQMCFLSRKCAKMRWRPGLRPGPRWGSLQRFPDPLAGLRGPTSKGRGSERRGGERGKGGEGTGGKGEGMGGKCPPF